MVPMNWPIVARLEMTHVRFMLLRHPENYWETQEAQKEMKRLLRSRDSEEVALGLSACICLIRPPNTSDVRTELARLLLPLVEKRLFGDPAIFLLASWAWGLIRPSSVSPMQPAPMVLDRLLRLLLSSIHPRAIRAAAWAIGTRVGIPRDAWQPMLKSAEAQQLLRLVSDLEQEGELYDFTEPLGIYMVAFHSRNVWSDNELAALLAVARDRVAVRYRDDRYVLGIETMLSLLGKAGLGYLKPKKPATDGKPAKR